MKSEKPTEVSSEESEAFSSKGGCRAGGLGCLGILMCMLSGLLFMSIYGDLDRLYKVLTWEKAEATVVSSKRIHSSFQTEEDPPEILLVSFTYPADGVAQSAEVEFYIDEYNAAYRQSIQERSSAGESFTVYYPSSNPSRALFEPKFDLASITIQAGIMLVGLLVATTFFIKLRRHRWVEGYEAWAEESLSRQKKLEANARNEQYANKFGDPVAGMTEWGELEAGGSSGRTHKLRVVSEHRLSFKEVFWSKVIGLIPVLFGLFIILSVIGSGGTEDLYGLLIALFAALLFCFVGFFFTSRSSAARVFDKNLGHYWRAKAKLIPGLKSDKVQDACSLDEIHAIQLISATFATNDKEGRRHRWQSYELNLVLHDGFRLNVVDHGDHSQILKDAKTLSEFLDVPIWNDI